MRCVVLPGSVQVCVTWWLPGIENEDTASQALTTEELRPIPGQRQCPRLEAGTTRTIWNSRLVNDGIKRFKCDPDDALPQKNEMPFSSRLPIV